MLMFSLRAIFIDFTAHAARLLLISHDRSRHRCHSSRRLPTPDCPRFLHHLTTSIDHYFLVFIVIYVISIYPRFAAAARCRVTSYTPR